MSDVVRSRHLEILASRDLRRELTRSARRIVGPSEVEDVVQCTLLRAIERVPSAAPDIHWRGWLHVVMRRLIADRARQAKQHKLLELTDVEQCPAHPPEGSPRWAHLTSADFDAALRVLERAPAFCETYHLFYDQGLSYQQIAMQLGVAEHTVASRLHRARAQLRLSLEGALSSFAADGDRR
jgi:RNA polymerase sigma factor (sigma-70 family)